MALKEELKKQGDFLFKYRSYLPLFLIIIGVLVKVYRSAGINELVYAERWNWVVMISLMVGLLGQFIRILTVGYTPKDTSGRNTTEGQVANTLNTQGLYSLIRNPLYLGNYFMWVAVAMLTGSISFVIIFSLVFWIYYERIVFAEEEFLREKFGEVYLEWADQTPPFIPIHWNYVPPKISFSWKKVLKKEKNGLSALFLAFFLMEMIGTYVQNGRVVFEMNWLSVLTILTGLLYGVLKFLKSQTKILDEPGR